MMQFDFKFPYGGDELFIAYTVPYTYSQVNTHIRMIREESEQQGADFIDFTSIGKSNGQLDMPLIQITNPSVTNEIKPTILIIGRQHSGETHSSFIIHGFMNFICSNDPQAFKLREHFQFWILPVMNPDGIVSGNYRCNTQGKDMNRFFFSDNDPEAEIRLTEVELFRSFLHYNFDKDKYGQISNKLCMFLDIHAHSWQRDIFIFAPYTNSQEQQEEIKSFPVILNHLSRYFNYYNCIFGNEQYKKNCARLAVFRDFKCTYSYTIESSCWGYSIPYQDDTVQFKELDFIKFGKHLAFGIAKQFNILVTDEEQKMEYPGLKIHLDFGLYEDFYEQENTKNTKGKKGKAKNQVKQQGKILKPLQLKGILQNENKQKMQQYPADFDGKDKNLYPVNNSVFLMQNVEAN